MEVQTNLAIKTLKTFGFTSSEIKIYKILIENDFLIVTDISKYANIPRTKTYEILKSLELKKVVQKQTGQPVKYRAKDPVQTLKKMREKLLMETEKGLDILQESWDQREVLDDKNPVTVYYGNTNYYRLFKGLEERVKVNLFLLFRFVISKEEIKLLKNIITINNKKGIKIELIIHPDVQNELEPKDLGFFKKNTVFSVAPIPIRAIISDDSELIIQIPSPGIKQDLIPDDIHNVIIRLPDLVSTIETSIRSSVSQIKTE